RCGPLHLRALAIDPYRSKSIHRESSESKALDPGLEASSSHLSVATWPLAANSRILDLLSEPVQPLGDYSARRSNRRPSTDRKVGARREIQSRSAHRKN